MGNERKLKNLNRLYIFVIKINKTMKKIYLSALALGLGTLAFGQVKQPALNKAVSTAKPVKTVTQAPGEKALGVAIWTDDFSSAAGWTINNNGITGAAYGWNIDAVNNSWFNAPIASPSGGAYAEVNNGATPNSSEEINVVYTMTSAAPLNITALGGNEFINLEFYQNGARFNDDQFVEISTNGTTFTRVYDNSDKPVLSSTGGSAYPNPDFVQVNLTPYLTANPGDIWIRFGWTSAFPTNQTLPAWITYGWQIDDVALRTLSDNDIELTGLYYGSEGIFYRQIPVAQIAPIDFAIQAFNKGSQTQTGVTFTANETGGTAYSSSSTPATIASLDTTTLVAGPFTPPGVGSYAFTFAYAADAVDDVPANNDVSAASYNFAVGQHIYARDNGTAAGSYNFGGTDPFELGNVFDIFAPTNLTAINVRLASATVVGIEIYGRLYDANLEFVAETDPYTVVAGDPGTELILPFSNPVALSGPSGANSYTTYVAVVGSFDAGLSISTGGTSAPQTTFVLDILDNETWYYTTSTPQVRMNFDPTISVGENANNELSVAAYPNPTATSTTVEYTLQNASDVSYKLVDATGQIVLSATENNVNTGLNQINVDAAALANGVYHFTITTNNATVTRKIIVNK
jgi:hypothetical protein